MAGAGQHVHGHRGDIAWIDEGVLAVANHSVTGFHELPYDLAANCAGGTGYEYQRAIHPRPPSANFWRKALSVALFRSSHSANGVAGRPSKSGIPEASLIFPDLTAAKWCRTT